MSTIARVFWEDVPGRPERFIMVEAHTAGDIAIAIVVLAQGMAATLEGFSPEVKAAAGVLVAALRADGWQCPPTLVVNVERGGRPKS